MTPLIEKLEEQLPAARALFGEEVNRFVYFDPLTIAQWEEIIAALRSSAK